MPPEVKTGSGQLVNVEGALSGEVDVILYSPAIMPPALFDDANGYFPVESALYTIEVKSRLEASHLKTAASAARTIRALPQLPTERFATKLDGRGVQTITGPTPLAINALFAFGSDLTSDPQNELDRYRKYDERADTFPAISVMCIVGRGYWHFAGRWKYRPADKDYGEVMTWLAGTVNTLPYFIAAKGRPRFGSYLTSGDTIVDARELLKGKNGPRNKSQSGGNQ
jgi:hypothetical protein